MSDHPWHTIHIRVPFATAEHAQIAKRVIDVDPELQPHLVTRTLSTDENILIAKFETSTIRLARLTANGFLENVDLVTRTFLEFGPEAEQPQ